MEQIIMDVRSMHVDKKECSQGSQHGFLSEKSHLTNLEPFCVDMTGWVYEGRALDVVFSKAFDTFSHQIFTCKIRCGLDERTMRWIKNWTNGRAQRVAVISSV